MWVCYLQVQRGIRKAWPAIQVRFSPSTAMFRSLALIPVCSSQHFGHRLALKSRCQPRQTGRPNCWRTIGRDQRVDWHQRHRQCAPPRVSPPRILAADPQYTPAHLEKQLSTWAWRSFTWWRKVWHRNTHHVYKGPPMAESSSHTHRLLLLE